VCAGHEPPDAQPGVAPRPLPQHATIWQASAWSPLPQHMFWYPDEKPYYPWTKGIASAQVSDDTFFEIPCEEIECAGFRCS
jgi:hypothetical protein